MNVATGFEPIAAPDARVLILGSLPSVLSLEKREYYGNPQNAFWRIMGELFAAGPELDYARRTERLKQCGVALWDVLHASMRPGSMDADIRIASAVPNDFPTFFGAHPNLELVCFNGKKAGELYDRLVLPRLDGTICDPQYETLPSTSPAHAAMSFEQKVHRWLCIRK